jgi:hypothetical protein
MARRNAQNDKPVDTEATAPESTDTQDQVEGTEAQAEGTETETPAKAEVDLTAFKEAATAALEDMDVDTGSLPLAATDKVGTEYRKLDGQKAKNRAKEYVEDSIREAIAGENPSMQRARAYVEIRDALAASTASKGSAPKEPVDPAVGYANRLASLALAQRIVANEVPDGVDADKANEQANELVTSLADQVEQYRTWKNSEDEDKGDAPEVSPVVKAAFKLATGRATGSGRTSSGGSGSSYDGPKGDVAKHLAEYFADKEVGHFAKISEIAKFKSEEYGDRFPSQGAITASLFNSDGSPKPLEKLRVKGVEPVEKSGDKPKGARKIEVDAA